MTLAIMEVMQMARKTKKNSITSPELIKQISSENTRIKQDYLSYLRSMQKSPGTIYCYENDLDIFFVWNMKYNNNKSFIKITKRDIVSFQNWLVNINNNSPARVRRIKATLSSLSNFIESICDDEYPDFKNIIHKVESPIAQPTREKTILKDEQLDSLLNYLVEKKKYDKACMLALAMCSGRRKAELVRFKESYFDDSNIIYGSLYKTPETVKTKGYGNGKFIHCYTLRHKFKPYLDMWLAERKKRGIESEWLFPLKDNNNEHLKPETLNSWANTFTKFLGVDFYWHCLRHYFTTHLVRMGLPDSVIQDIIGWSSADMLRLYTDIPVDEQIGKYFDENGIKTVDKTSISDL